jgi:hypothetical protein
MAESVRILTVYEIRDASGDLYRKENGIWSSLTGKGISEEKTEELNTILFKYLFKGFTC